MRSVCRQKGRVGWRKLKIPHDRASYASHLHFIFGGESPSRQSEKEPACHLHVISIRTEVGLVRYPRATHLYSRVELSSRLSDKHALLTRYPPTNRLAILYATTSEV